MADDLPKLFELAAGANGHVAPRSLARRPDFTLGGANVRPSVRTIEGPAGTSATEPRVMQVLLALVDAEGTVLTRDDLLQSCWNGQIVGDDSINRAIAEVRRVARETRAGFTIETIPRIGYRLKLELPEHPSVASGQAPAAALRSSRRGLLVGAAGVAAVGLAGGAWWLMRRPGLDPTTAGLVSESEQALRQAMPDGDLRAVALLEQAVQRRPEDGSLWGKLALARALVHEHGTPADPGKIVTAAESAAGRALTLEPRNADAHAAKAILVPYYGDWLAAERRFDAVLAIEPEHVVTRDERDFFLNAVGRVHEGSLDRIDLSRDHPLDAGIQFRLVYANWMLDRIGEADRVAARAMELWPRHPGVWLSRLWMFACTGRFDRALAHINSANARPTFPPPMFAAITASVQAAMSGSPDAKANAVERVMALVAKSPLAVVNGMMLLNLLGALDHAFALAEAYYVEKGPLLADMQWRPGQSIVRDQRRRKTNMLFVPVAQKMREDARFPPLMEAMGLAEYWGRRGIVPDYQRPRT